MDYFDGIAVLALRRACHILNLRNRVERPEKGWRLNDIIGAPRRAQEPGR